MVVSKKIPEKEDKCKGAHEFPACFHELMVETFGPRDYEIPTGAPREVNTEIPAVLLAKSNTDMLENGPTESSLPLSIEILAYELG